MKVIPKARPVPVTPRPVKPRKQKKKRSFPEPLRVDQKQWSTFGLNEHSALKVMPNSLGGHDYILNDDNVFVRAELQNVSPEGAKALKFQYSTIMTLVGMSMLRDTKDSADETKNIEAATSSLSRVIFPLMRAFG